MSLAQTSGVTLLGFLTIQETQDNSGYLGSCMVTDLRGNPLEFRVLTPVKPTPLQRILYGDGFERYIAIELCGKKLLKEISRKPSIVLVDRRELLELAAELPNTVTVIHLRRPGDAVAVKEERKGALDIEEGRFEPTSGSIQPVIWEGAFLTETKKKEVLPLLSSCLQELDLVEVFSRMRAAVQLLAKNDAKYR
ncbi:MAG: hypothetical protein ACE5I2_07810 [Anaerolineae bacterium]